MKELIEHLSPLITDQRWNRFNEVLAERTQYITIVLENIYQPLNASAVLRSADCFGIQDVHVIENHNEFTPDREVAMGSSKWLNIKRYNEEENNTLQCIKKLKKEGYRIVATTPHKNDCNLHKFQLAKGKTALLFGTEMEGLTDVALKEADEFLKILHQLGNDQNVFVISHKGDILSDKFRSTIRFEKHKNFSRIAS